MSIKKDTIALMKRIMHTGKEIKKNERTIYAKSNKTFIGIG